MRLRAGGVARASPTRTCRADLAVALAARDVSGAGAIAGAFSVRVAAMPTGCTGGNDTAWAGGDAAAAGGAGCAAGGGCGAGGAGCGAVTAGSAAPGGGAAAAV